MRSALRHKKATCFEKQMAGKKKCQEATAMKDKLRLLRFRPDRIHKPTLRNS